MSPSQGESRKLQRDWTSTNTLDQKKDLSDHFVTLESDGVQKTRAERGIEIPLAAGLDSSIGRNGGNGCRITAKRL
jgi:hypothetical protein